MDFIKSFEALVPTSPLEEINWDAVEDVLGPIGFSDMTKTPQNPAYHGEGDVYAHTRLVCRELNRLEGFHALPSGRKTALFLAALLHDIGKIRTTRWENENWTSPHHASTGSRMAREFLWRNCGLCGTGEAQQFRELVCGLVRYHMLPMHLLEQEDPERKAREIAAIGELAPDFSWELLCLLSEADARGRIAPDVDELVEQIRLCRLLAEEAGCLNGPYPFVDDCAKRAYFSGRKVAPDQTLFDSTWGEVLLLSGLPGTGKDTWIQGNAPVLPMISLDEIRKELGVGPSGDQGVVIQQARERAKVLLRERKPFIWNATDLSKDIRGNQIELFERYGARVRIVYLETPWEVQMERNRNREDAVPQGVIEHLLEKTEPPTPNEARRVDWYCI